MFLREEYDALTSCSELRVLVATAHASWHFNDATLNHAMFIVDSARVFFSQ